MKNFIEGYVNALTAEECKTIIDYMNEEVEFIPGKFKEPNTGKDIIRKERKDSSDVIMNMNEDTEVNDILYNSLCKCIDDYKIKNPHLNQLLPWKWHPIYNLQKYNPGQGYHDLHCENMSPESSYRVAVWMFYLNTVNDDGGTYFDNYDLTMNAVEGRCVIWPAYWTHFHKGIVSKTETKYIATGWFNYIDIV